jgi:predicted small lipoprotein YifL
LKKKIIFVIMVTAVMLMMVQSCGKKGPPFIPKERVPHRVKELKGEWSGGDVILSGKVGERDENDGKRQEITGCRVYYAWYSFENAPCDGCPISFKELKTIEAEVVKGKRFRCEVTDIRKRGVHFFRVGLIGSNGEVGPLSNTAKLLSEQGK